MISYIAIDRNYLEAVDFAPIYTEIRTWYNYASDSSEWTYNMTDMVRYQLKESTSPSISWDFKIISEYYNKLGKE